MKCGIDSSVSGTLIMVMLLTIDCACVSACVDIDLLMSFFRNPLASATSYAYTYMANFHSAAAESGEIVYLYASARDIDRKAKVYVLKCKRIRSVVSKKRRKKIYQLTAE